MTETTRLGTRFTLGKDLKELPGLVRAELQRLTALRGLRMSPQGFDALNAFAFYLWTLLFRENEASGYVGEIDVVLTNLRLTLVIVPAGESFDLDVRQDGASIDLLHGLEIESLFSRTLLLLFAQHGCLGESAAKASDIDHGITVAGGIEEWGRVWKGIERRFPE